MPSQEKILHIKGLKTYFPVRKGLLRTVAAHVKAVDGVDLEIYRGETLGLVGESGCGKTTLGKSIIQLVGAVGGQILYQEGEQTYDLLNLSAEEFKHIRQKIQIVFQDPHSSLNPAFTVFGSLQDPLKLYGVKTKAERRKIIGDLLEAVNMRREQMDNYPHEFSGGQRQRIGIARALCVNPEVVICDEAVSALDVSIQAQVLQLLQEIKQARGLTYIFITHDLSVVEYISDRVAVMYLGKIVELAESEALYRTPRHPYTQALLSAIPIADLDRKSDRIVLEGDVPNPVSPPSGCAFHPRCPKFKSLSEP
ncbi:MAG: ABC transporter ATP-binding protein, partial [SAR324 cluster bacterium]|nr:ABC transporter ATP-binding protein [SAR324 cluster bacterium]